MKQVHVIKNASCTMPSDLKYENRWLILSVFRDGKQYTVKDISEKTGISRPTVMKAIKYFCHKNLLSSMGLGDSTDVGGKKPEYFKFCKPSYLLCITLWPSSLNFTLYDLVSHKLDFTAHTIKTDISLDESFAILKRTVSVFMDKNHISNDDLFGVGLSTSGIVDYQTGNLYYNTYAPCWGKNIAITSRLNKIFGDKVMVFVENAGKSVGRSVLRDDNLKKLRVMTFFTSWGISACFIERGHVLNGKDSIIGEIGKSVFNSDGSTLEENLSLQHLQKILLTTPPPKESLLSSIPRDQVTRSCLFEASKKQDVYARVIVRQLAQTIALAIHNCSLLFDPDLVVFQGDFAFGDDYFNEQLQLQASMYNRYNSKCLYKVVYDTRSLYDLDAIGLSSALSNVFFRSDGLYKNISSNEQE